MAGKFGSKCELFWDTFYFLSKLSDCSYLDIIWWMGLAFKYLKYSCYCKFSPSRNELIFIFFPRCWIVLSTVHCQKMVPLKLCKLSLFNLKRVSGFLSLYFNPPCSCSWPPSVECSSWKSNVGKYSMSFFFWSYHEKG